MSSGVHGTRYVSTAVTWRDAVRDGAIAFVFLAAFPKLGYWARWPARLGWRGLLGYVVFNIAVGFVMRAWVFPYVKRVTEAQERAKEQVRQELGREPTEREFFEHLEIPWKG